MSDIQVHTIPTSEQEPSCWAVYLETFPAIPTGQPLLCREYETKDLAMEGAKAYGENEHARNPDWKATITEDADHGIFQLFDFEAKLKARFSVRSVAVAVEPVELVEIDDQQLPRASVDDAEREAQLAPKEQPASKKRKAADEVPLEPAAEVAENRKTKIVPVKKKAKISSAPRKAPAADTTKVEKKKTKELVSEKETRKTSPPPAKPKPEPKYCRCKKPDDGRMLVQCDALTCPNNRWVHLACMGMKVAPPDDGSVWFCRDCMLKRRRKGVAMKVRRAPKEE